MSNVNAAISNKHLRDGMIKSKSTKMVDWVIAVVCFVFMLLCLLPIVHVLACSLSSPEALIRNEVFLWPKGWNIEAYKTVLTTEKYVRSLGFTAILTIGCTLVSLALTICCAYPLIYPNLRGAKLINFLYVTADYDTYKFQSMLALDAMPESKIWEEADEYWRRPELTVALKWSNLYSAYAIKTKLATLRAMRRLDVEDTSRDQDALSDYEVEQMAVVEHDRWNVEKLLMGYRKPRKEEDKYLHPECAGQLSQNKKLFIHHDIRPFGTLGIIAGLDREFSRYIPWIMRMTEKK